MKATFKIQEDGAWLIDGVILSYPNLWKPGMYEGKPKNNLDSSLLLDAKTDKGVIKEIMKALVALARTLNPKITKLGQTLNPKLNKSKDGKHWIISTTNSVNYPPVGFDSSGSIVRDPLAEGLDRQLYAGCYVKVKLSVNPDDSSGKVKLWCNISAIQFQEHGEKLGGGPTDAELSEGFGKVDTDFDKSVPSVDDLDDDDLDDDDFEFDEDEI